MSRYASPTGWWRQARERDRAARAAMPGWARALLLAVQVGPLVLAVVVVILADDVPGWAWLTLILTCMATLLLRATFDPCRSRRAENRYDPLP